jgi:uncharacterized protein (TIGR02284 family)
MNNDAIAVLNELIETSRDGEKGFQKAGHDTESAELRAMFSEGARRCAEGARELQDLVRQLGGKPDTTGSVAGALHRGWINVKEAVSRRDDQAILDEVERGEDYAKEAYRKALDAKLPANAQAIVQRQYQGVLANHDKVKALRQQYRTVTS